MVPMQVIGLDIGGTSVRAVVCDGAGRCLGYAKGPGANFRFSAGDAVENVRSTVAAALEDAGMSAADVAAVGVGAAGAGEGGRERVVEMLDAALGPLGLPSAALTLDLAIAFRSVAPSPDGVLLLAGTGAAAVRFEDWEVAARCDGMGWMLGDEGSGAWIGQHVIRLAAADLDARGPRTALTARVLDQLGIPGDGDPRQHLIAAAYALAPAEWGRFAPLAWELDGEDEQATALLDRAAERLMVSADAVGAGGEVVFAGGLLREGPLRARLARRFDGVYAEHPVVGACALAAASVGEDLDRAALASNLPSA